MGGDGSMMLMKFEVCVRDLAGRLAGSGQAAGGGRTLYRSLRPLTSDA